MMRELTKAEQAIPAGGGGAQPMPPVTVIGMEDNYQSTYGSVFSFGGVGGTGINVSDKPLYLKTLGEYNYARQYYTSNPNDVPTLGTIEVTATNVNVGQICQLETGVSNGFDPVMYNDGSGNITIACGASCEIPAKPCGERCRMKQRAPMGRVMCPDARSAAFLRKTGA